MAENRVRLRWAQEEDVGSILELVRELAEFEKELNSVTLTEEKMKVDLKERHFVCILAEDTSQEESGGDPFAVGMALCHTRYSTWDGLCMHLEDLYVKPEHRGKGIGRLLIEACVKYTNDLKCKRLCWEVLDWNTRAIDFYKGLGSEFKEAWRCVRLSGSSLRNFNFRNKIEIDERR